MSDYTAIFNGHDLSDLFIVGRPQRHLVAWEPDLIDMPAGFGSLFAGTHPQAMEVSIALTTMAETLEERLAAWSTLNGWLYVTEPKELYLSDETFVWTTEYTLPLMRYAVPSGGVDIDYAHNCEQASVRFVCPDPRAVAILRIDGTGDPSIFSPSTGGTINGVYGTAPTGLRIRMTGVHGSNYTDKFRVSIVTTDADGNRVPEFSGRYDFDINRNASQTIVIDSEKRTLTVDGVTTMMPPENAEWVRICGGYNVTISATAGGCDTITTEFVPRWW